MDRHTSRAASLPERLRRLTASFTTGGVMLVGTPVMLEYVVRPGDTLSEIAVHQDTSVEALVDRNDLHHSGDRVVAGESLDIPAAHDRPSSPRQSGAGRTDIDPDARRIMRYTVRPGDTPGELAVRFHAWTAEIIERNGSVLRAGEQIEIPVVVAAAARARRTSSSEGSSAPRTSEVDPGSAPRRATVRRIIAATARRHGVDPDLALAVSWQESGWRMDRTSTAGAVGAMQVLPSTGRWMSDVVGRTLHLRDLQDNAAAGVALLDLLDDRAGTRVAVAGYYQGLAGVRRHGMYPDTQRYVASVIALKRQFEEGDYPA
ncbi:MAG TPA: LysM peptidoglycan-binding domain-containing protein [Nocardioidaceae bacterium]|nr:LysM peptidoglycan-binding domain-containing protein [Nocardioidaceae bacterium]